MKVRYNQMKYLSTWDINEFQQKLRDTNRPVITTRRTSLKGIVEIIQ